MRELFHGAFGVEGERKTYEAVLRDLGVTEQAGIKTPVGKITARGMEGLALDIALDPLTYVTFGAAPALVAFSKGGKALGKVSLTKAGHELMADIAKSMRPDTLEIAKRFASSTVKDVPGGPIGSMSWLQDADKLETLLYHERYKEAGEKIWQIAQLGYGQGLIDEGGVKMFGQTVIPGSAFGRPLKHTGSKLAKLFDESPTFKPMWDAVKKGAQEIEGVFNEVRFAARKLPGMQLLVTDRRDLFHSEQLNVKKALLKSLPEEMNQHKIDTTVLGPTVNRRLRQKEMPLKQYFSLHMDDPEVFPLELIPASYHKSVTEMRALMAHYAQIEVAIGKLPAQYVRPNYMPHFWNNTEKEWQELNKVIPSEELKSLFEGKWNWGPHNLQRGFRTFNEAFNYMDELEMKGLLPKGFELKPILDPDIAIFKRAENFNSEYTKHLLLEDLKRAYGHFVLPDLDKVANNLMPQIGSMFANAPSGKLVGAVAGRARERIESVQQRYGGMQVNFVKKGSPGQEGKAVRVRDGQLVVDYSKLRQQYKDPGIWRRQGVEPFDSFEEWYGFNMERAFLSTIMKQGEGVSNAAYLKELNEKARVGMYDAASPRTTEMGTILTQGEKVMNQRQLDEVVGQGFQDIGLQNDPDMAKTLTKEEIVDVIHKVRNVWEIKGKTKRKGEVAWYKKQKPEAQALYVLARMQHLNGWDDMQSFLVGMEKEINALDPQIVKKMRHELGLGMRKTLDSHGEGYALVGSGPWKGFAMPAQVVAEINRLQRGFLDTKQIHGLLKTFDLTQDVFKLGSTVLFPSFHFRNAYSNVAQIFVALGLQGMNPLAYMKAGQIMMPKNFDGTIVTPAGRLTYEHVRTLMQRFGIIKDFEQILEMRTSELGALRRQVLGKEKFGPTVEFIGAPILHPGRFALKKMSALGGRIENTARAMLFISDLERGIPPAQAAERVKKFLFDYEQLSPVERNALTRLFPFYKWTKKNLALTLTEMARQPGKYATMFKLGNPAEQGPEKDALPWYQRGSLKIRLHKDGNSVFINGLDLPAHSALNFIFNGDVMDTMRQNAGMLAPAVKLIPELATRTEFFSGRNMEERAQINGLMTIINKMPAPIQQWLEVSEETDPTTGDTGYKMNGTKAYLLFRSYAHSRFLNSFDRLLRDDRPIQLGLIQLMTGIEGREIDLDVEQKRILRRRIKQLEDRLIERGALRAKRTAYEPEGVTFR